MINVNMWAALLACIALAASATYLNTPGLGVLSVAFFALGVVFARKGDLI